MACAGSEEGKMRSNLELAIQRIIDQMSFSSSVNGINTAGKV